MSQFSLHTLLLNYPPLMRFPSIYRATLIVAGGGIPPARPHGTLAPRWPSGLGSSLLPVAEAGVTLLSPDVITNNYHTIHHPPSTGPHTSASAPALAPAPAGRPPLAAARRSQRQPLRHLRFQLDVLWKMLHGNVLERYVGFFLEQKTRVGGVCRRRVGT